MSIQGKCWKYGDNVNTDEIIPARYLNTTDAKELGSHCMEDADAAFAGRVAAGDVIVGGRNFGCGSSREHAPVAIRACGVAAVIARSFARIFYRNCINMGLPIVASDEAVDGIEAGHEIEVDVAAGVIHNRTTGAEFAVPPFPPQLRAIMDAGGLMAYVKQQAEGK